MKVILDISQIVYGTGVSVYTKEIAKGLSKKVQLILFAGVLRRRDEIDSFVNELGGNKIISLPIPPKALDVLWNRLHVAPIEALAGKADIYHSSDWAQAPSNCTKVTTIHDLSPIYNQQYAPTEIVEQTKRRMHWVKKEVEQIIVPTNYVKEKCVEFGLKEKNIHVVYEAVPTEFLNHIKGRKQRESDHYYLLAVGTHPRKNNDRIISAFNKVRRVKTNSNLKLVIVGDGVSGDGLIYTGRVTTAKLVDLYTNARALVYPSIDEGFGLPILEAMACDCPVVTSNHGAMKEVAARAAVMVNHESESEIADGIIEAMGKSASLRKLGRERVSHFSWERAVEEVLDVYKFALER